MIKYMGLKQAAMETGWSEYALRMYCKQGRIRHNKSGVKYILRMDCLLEDLEKFATESVVTQSEANSYGQLRKIKN